MNDDAIQQNGTGGSVQDDGTINGSSIPSLAELEKLQTDLVSAEARINELTETSKRAYADLQNYRRLAEQERGQYVAFANINFIREILPIVDNFSRAFEHVPPDVMQTDWYKGVVQIEQQLVGFLKKAGVEEMPSSVGQKLDPLKQEPLMSAPGEADIVLEEFEKGYMIGGQVIRPAKVKVGNGQ